ncbi:hypothetical protein BKA70DRAFT_267575 [Coprinopsis sp. MPI-PUGE-AT-0042]|nr:hypothetical protein BKA70DRAFT_267575 [Coprinopsis sp. MPI-PUGE-AT-0042]
MSVISTLPGEILDAIVDSAAETFSTRSPFGVKTTPELVNLLKNVALSSHHLRERAQRHLFLQIRLEPFRWHRARKLEYIPSTWDDLMSIFNDNPRLLDYPRLLVIMPGQKDRNQSGLHPHFVSVVLPFFANRLRRLNYLQLLCFGRRRWSTLPDELQDSILGSLRGNNLKGFKVQGLILPAEFLEILPSTLEACHLGLDMEVDLNFAAKYIKPRARTDNATVQVNIVSPRYLRIEWMRPTDTPWGWIHNQAESVFRCVTSLDVEIKDFRRPSAFMERIPGTLVRLTLRHVEVRNVLAIRHSTLQQTPFRHLPNLKELNVFIVVTECRTVTCPVQAALVAGDYAWAFTSVSIFRLSLGWKIIEPNFNALQDMEWPPMEPFIPQTADGFGRLDDILSDRSVLSSLKEVKINVEPKHHGPFKMRQEKVKDLQDLIWREAMMVFHKTSSRVHTFSLVTDNVFT